VPADREAPSWKRPACLRIGEALLNAPDRTLTPPQITAAGGGENVGRTAGAMFTAGLLEALDAPPPPKGTRGRRSDTAFRLPDDQVELVEAYLSRSGPGRFEAGHQAVIADAEAGQLSRLFEALEVSDVLPKAAWHLLWDGQPQQYVIDFVGEDAVDLAIQLVAELSGAGIPARRSSVAQVAPAEGLVFQARRGAAAARKARMRAQAQQG
jgi:hypothetical protein